MQPWNTTCSVPRFKLPNAMRLRPQNSARLSVTTCSPLFRQNRRNPAPKAHFRRPERRFQTEAAIKATMKMLNIIENEYENNNG